jgi:hypothetical protein
MILRSVIKHVRDQNWLAIGIDFLIVVIGVFIGIQVANWNSVRLDRIEADKVLERLEREFQMHLGRTERSLDRHEASLAAAARLIESIRDGRFNDETLHNDVEIVSQFSTPPGPSTTLQELVSSGRMGLLESSELRDALLEYNDYVEMVRSHYAVFTDPLIQSRAALLRARTLLVTGVPSAEITQAWTTESVDRATLVEDPEVIAALQIAYGTQDNAHAVLQANQRRIRVILDLIDASQDSRR